MSPNKHFDDEEVTRVAMRIAMSKLSDIQSKAKSDVDLLREYIKLCPYVAVDSPAIQGALEGLATVVLEDDDSNQVDIQIPQLQTDSGSSSPRNGNWPTPLNSPNLKVTTTEPVQKEAVKKNPYRMTALNKFLSTLGFAFRTLLLDTPLALVFALYLFSVWTHHVHDKYLVPEFAAMAWDSDRQEAEETYYKRFCFKNDVSTLNGEKIFLPMNASAKEAYKHQLIHGATIFQSVLSEKTSTNLREFIRSKNFKLPEEKSIFVIANKKRYSFGLGTEEPTVTAAMKELANNKRLKPALEMILGPNPALIEMTAITSTYGAKPQYWHDDVVSRASALQFGRSFGPSYSVFVQLQNTTKAMGATDVCPGTHFCAAGAMEQFCEKHGFQVVGHDGIWKTGDAMLMNMNLFHRGAGHIEKGGEDRVMLILTFVPKPQTHAESRMLSQGITFSLRWDMWGHTLDDLAQADTRMAQPWATLRALGLYKHHKDAAWGVDYIHGSMMRIAAGDAGYREEELEEYIEKGGFKVLPKFLEGQVDLESESWADYYRDTLFRCEKFLKQVNLGALAAYLALQLLVLVITMIIPQSSKTGALRRFGWASMRLMITHGIIYALYLTAIRHVDNTQWARDVRAGRRFTNPFASADNEFQGPTTFVQREDILIETRYKSAHLAMYNDWINLGHPGNREWNELLESTALLYEDYSGLPPIFRQQLPEYMVGTMESQQRRFLYQGVESNWHILSRPDALKYNEKQLKISSNHVLRFVWTRLEYLISECKHGHLRETAMVKFDTFPFLKDFQKKLLAAFEPEDEPAAPLARFPDTEGAERPVPRPVQVMHRSLALRRPVTKPRFVRRPVSLKVGVPPGEPKPGAWRTEGDVMEARLKHEGVYKWYYATVRQITSMNWHLVEFYDGFETYVTPDSIRPYVPFELGESVEVWHHKKFQRATIVDYGENHVHAEIVETGEMLHGLFKGNVRRAVKVSQVKKKKKRNDDKYKK